MSGGERHTASVLVPEPMLAVFKKRLKVLNAKNDEPRMCP